LNPDQAEVHYNFGYAYRQQQRLEEAAGQFREGLRLQPAFPPAEYNLGCVLAAQGRNAEAAAHLPEALRLKPDYRDATQKLADLKLAPVNKP
jgi:tetratricopeptide (TPR) repeat protein